MRIHNYVPCERFDILHLCYICFLHLKGRAYRFGAQVLAESHVTCIDFPVVLAHFDSIPFVCKFWLKGWSHLCLCHCRTVPGSYGRRQVTTFQSLKKTFNLKSSSQTGNQLKISVSTFQLKTLPKVFLLPPRGWPESGAGYGQV